jgi:hypothetical protein
LCYFVTNIGAKNLQKLGKICTKSTGEFN